MSELGKVRDKEFLEYLKSRVIEKHLEDMLLIRRVPTKLLNDREKMLRKCYYAVLTEYKRNKKSLSI